MTDPDPATTTERPRATVIVASHELSFLIDACHATEYAVGADARVRDALIARLYDALAELAGWPSVDTSEGQVRLPW